MRWKIGHGGHDPRHIDLIAAFALLILIVAACHFLSGSPRDATGDYYHTNRIHRAVECCWQRVRSESGEARRQRDRDIQSI